MQWAIFFLPDDFTPLRGGWHRESSSNDGITEDVIVSNLVIDVGRQQQLQLLLLQLLPLTLLLLTTVFALGCLAWQRWSFMSQRVSAMGVAMR